MSHADIQIIDPLQSKIPELAVVQKVLSDAEKLPEDQHDQAVKAFLVSDGIASGIGKDLAFVDKIPQFIKEIIDNKLWECLFVSKGVVTPYYCCYVKGSDSENFRAFISAKRPNGLGSSVETIDRVLQADLEVQRKFRAIIYQAPEKERDELGRYKSSPEDSDYPLEDSLQSAQQKRIRAAHRAAEVIPVIGDLLDRGLIAIDVAARLGRDIKDPENLTAEEREYVDRRDLIGLRLDQYIYTNPVPEDEDREPAYGRELNRFVKDLLGVKDRSKPIRMDNPKKAAEKLLQHYQGENLRELIDCLKKGLELSPNLDLPALKPADSELKATSPISGSKVEALADKAKSSKTVDTSLDQPKGSLQKTRVAKKTSITKEQNVSTSEEDGASPHRYVEISKELNVPKKLKAVELAERLGVSYRTLAKMMFPKERDKFPEWSRNRDPDGWTWQPVDEGKGHSKVFEMVQKQ
jgi:hypothetical protein